MSIKLGPSVVVSLNIELLTVTTRQHSKVISFVNFIISATADVTSEQFNSENTSVIYNHIKNMKFLALNAYHAYVIIQQS